MDPKVIDTLRYAALVAILLVVGIFCFRTYKSMDRRKQAVAAMRTDISNASLYHALTPEDAKKTLLRCLGRIEHARKLGIEPSAFFDSLFEKTKKQVADDDSYAPVKEQLVRENIGMAYEHARQLGLFNDASAVKTLLDGELPDITPAPVIVPVIDPVHSPGIDRVVPNLQILPQAKKAGTPLTDVERSLVRKLIYQLVDANVIQREAAKRIETAYEDPKPEAAPK